MISFKNRPTLLSTRQLGTRLCVIIDMRMNRKVQINASTEAGEARSSGARQLIECVRKCSLDDKSSRERVVDREIFMERLVLSWQNKKQWSIVILVFPISMSKKKELQFSFVKKHRYE